MKELAPDFWLMLDILLMGNRISTGFRSDLIEMLASWKSHASIGRYSSWNE